MQADQEWGDGYQPVLVSWYDHNNNSDGMVKGVRVSFMNPNTGAYRHVLLVYPQEKSGIIDYDAVRVSQDSSNSSYTTSLHATASSGTATTSSSPTPHAASGCSTCAAFSTSARPRTAQPAATT